VTVGAAEVVGAHGVVVAVVGEAVVAVVAVSAMHEAGMAAAAVVVVVAVGTTAARGEKVTVHRPCGLQVGRISLRVRTVVGAVGAAHHRTLTRRPTAGQVAYSRRTAVMVHRRTTQEAVVLVVEYRAMVGPHSSPNDSAVTTGTARVHPMRKDTTWNTRTTRRDTLTLVREGMAVVDHSYNLTHLYFRII
jgi:hypothetical protein